MLRRVHDCIDALEHIFPVDVMLGSLPVYRQNSFVIALPALEMHRILCVSLPERKKLKA